MSNNNKHLALKHCANWDVGKCLGVKMRYVRGEGLITIIDSDMNGKECFVNDECSYFESIVRPGIPIEKTYRKRKTAY